MIGGIHILILLVGHHVVSLPRIFFLQVDNTVKDNKITYSMAFGSLLMTKYTLKEVKDGV